MITAIELLLNNHMALFNCIICGVIFIHGVCVVNHMNRSTPIVYVLGFSLLTVGAFSVLIGAPYGYISNEPQEICMNFGLMVIQLFAAYKRNLKWGGL